MSEVSQILRWTLGIYLFFLTSIHSLDIHQSLLCQALNQTLGTGSGTKARGGPCSHGAYGLGGLIKGHVHVLRGPNLACGGVGWLVEGILRRENSLCQDSAVGGSKVVHVPEGRWEWRIPENTDGRGRRQGDTSGDQAFMNLIFILLFNIFT